MANNPKDVKEIKTEHKPLVLQYRLPIDFNAATAERQVSAANQFIVQDMGEQHIFSFFHAAPPIFVGEDADMEQQLKAMTYVKPDCIARMVATRGFAEEVIKTLTDHLNRVDARRSEGAVGDTMDRGTDTAEPNSSGDA